ncbi:MAG TPA: hypothetical protein VI670_14080 [Thermoanaerobaculia bacterium]|jgi:hypothetical protein
MERRVEVREWGEFQWPCLIAFLGGEARLTELARETGAFERARKIGSPSDLFTASSMPLHSFLKSRNAPQRWREPEVRLSGFILRVVNRRRRHIDAEMTFNLVVSALGAADDIEPERIDEPQRVVQNIRVPIPRLWGHKSEI